MAAKPGESIQQYDAGIKSAAAVDPSGGDVVLTRVTRGVYIGGSGNLAVVFCDDADNAPQTLTGLATGVWHPIQARVIKQTNTTATLILVGY